MSGCVVRPSSEFLASVSSLRGGDRVIACYQCGSCSGSCPTAPAMDFTPRSLLHMIRLGMDQRVLRSRAIWLCTSCYLCTTRCPREIKITDALITLRSLAVAQDLDVPQNLKSLRETLAAHYNISGDDNDTRLIWSQNLEGNCLTFRGKRQAEVLFFVGCVASFYPTVYGIPQAMAMVMERAGVDYAALGGDEWCCGYPLYSAGMESDIAVLMEHNLSRARAMGASTLVTTCPSCYYTWQHIYPRLTGAPLGLEVLHASQFLARIVEKGVLKLGAIEQVLTYHDPCDLGRKSGVYDEPRRVIEAIPGAEFREMQATRQDALCCGGGGDVQMVDEGVTAAVADRRIRQAQASGAQVLLSACQQCKRTLAAAARRDKARLRVMDLAELLWKAMET